MKRLYAFELSGEHPTIPKSEALALLEIYSLEYRVISSLDRCLIVEASDLDLDIGARLAMTHRILQVQSMVDADLEAIMNAAGELDIPKLRYKVRAKRLGLATLPNDLVERKVGSVLWERGYQADLKDPEIEIRVLTTGEKAILGLEVARVDRGTFELRRPHLKPFFHPGAMGPRMARALVNMARLKAGERLLDPFSGTGGFLVEAGLMGIRGVGVDAQEYIVRGAKSNLSGLPCDLVAGDARRIPLRSCSIEGAVSDVPYGRSARIEAGSRDELLVRSLEELYRVLIPGRYMVFVDDRSIGYAIKKSGFKVIEVHEERIHRSLTRHVYISCR